jgi:hypothetical protein
MSTPLVVDSYDTLQQVMALYMKRQDLNNLIPHFINLAEEWFDDNVYTRARRSSYIFSVNQSKVVMPSDWKRVLNVWYNGNRLDFFPTDFNGGYPKDAQGTELYNALQIIGNYSILNVQDLGGICQIDYYSILEPLSETNDSNWLLEDSPNTYLFGALYQAGVYMRDDIRAGQWMAFRDAAIQSKLDDDQKSKYPEEQPLTIRAG